MQLSFSKAAVKSGFMRGLGETQEEKTMDDLRDHNVTVLTLHQYLLPTPRSSGCPPIGVGPFRFLCALLIDVVVGCEFSFV